MPASARNWYRVISGCCGRRRRPIRQPPRPRPPKVGSNLSPHTPHITAKQGRPGHESRARARDALRNKEGVLRNDKQRATTLVTGNQTEEERKQAAAELLSRVSHVQADSRASVVRSLQLVDTSERVAKDTALLVKAQTEQLKDIHADAQSLEAQVGLANALVVRCIQTSLCLPIPLTFGLSAFLYPVAPYTLPLSLALCICSPHAGFWCMRTRVFDCVCVCQTCRHGWGVES